MAKQNGKPATILFHKLCNIFVVDFHCALNWTCGRVLTRQPHVSCMVRLGWQFPMLAGWQPWHAVLHAPCCFQPWLPAIRKVDCLAPQLLHPSCRNPGIVERFLDPRVLIHWDLKKLHMQRGCRWGFLTSRQMGSEMSPRAVTGLGPTITWLWVPAPKLHWSFLPAPVWLKLLSKWLLVPALRLQ